MRFHFGRKTSVKCWWETDWPCRARYTNWSIVALSTSASFCVRVRELVRDGFYLTFIIYAITGTRSDQSINQSFIHICLTLYNYLRENLIVYAVPFIILMYLRNKFHFLRFMEVWTQRATYKISDDRKFARDPLGSYFHEPQKKWN